MIYKVVGKIVIKVAKNYTLLRYGRQLRIGLAAAVIAAGIGIFIASRDVEEG